MVTEPSTFRRVDMRKDEAVLKRGLCGLREFLTSNLLLYRLNYKFSSDFPRRELDLSNHELR